MKNYTNYEINQQLPQKAINCHIEKHFVPLLSIAFWLHRGCESGGVRCLMAYECSFFLSFCLFFLSFFFFWWWGGILFWIVHNRIRMFSKQNIWKHGALCPIDLLSVFSHFLPSCLISMMAIKGTQERCVCHSWGACLTTTHRQLA